MRLRFSAARRPNGLSVTASRARPRPARSDDDDTEWMDEEGVLEIIDGELTLPTPDPEPAKTLPPPFKVGFAKDDDRPLPLRSI